MQGYSYSVFSIVAIIIHLVINYDLLAGRGLDALRVQRYRGFLFGVLVYYLADGAWGVFAGLRWMAAWYVDTIFFFLSLVVFSLMWCRFLVVYLNFGKTAAKALTWPWYAILGANVVLLAANPFCGCVFYFDGSGTYCLGPTRDFLIYLQIAFNLLMSVCVLAKALRGHGPARGRNMMVFANGVMLTAAMILQVVWPLTPFTSLGCLVGTCFLHIFVVRDEQSERHTAELEAALERARAAEKSRSMFFSIVSHDIRTPLNAILGYAELLRHDALSGGEKSEALESIRSSAGTLMQLVNDVLDIARMDAGRMKLREEPVDVGKVADDVLASFKLDAAKKRISLVNRTAGVPLLALDKQRFRQVLFILVGNAVKFTGKGIVAVDASLEGDNLRLSVSDTGCGIDADQLTRIFDPYAREIDPSHSTYKEIGTGLGLSICKRLAEMAGGGISVESEVGKGSVFTLRLPAEISTVGTAAPAAGAATAAARSGLPRRVLVIDDSPINCSVLKAFLKKAGVAEVDCAGDGSEAFARLDSTAGADNPYDFVFSDLWMPEMNGLELIEKLRSDGRFAHLPVYAVTADTEYRNDERWRLFNGVFLKPLSYANVADALKRSLPRAGV